MTVDQARVGETYIAGLLADAVALELDLGDGSEVDVDALFTDLGLDSTGVVVVSSEVADRLGVPIPPELLFDHPTVRSLARFLAEAHPPVAQADPPVTVPSG